MVEIEEDRINPSMIRDEGDVHLKCKRNMIVEMKCNEALRLRLRLRATLSGEV